jgi:hypothetical protein
VKRQLLIDFEERRKLMEADQAILIMTEKAKNLAFDLGSQTQLTQCECENGRSLGITSIDCVITSPSLQLFKS